MIVLCKTSLVPSQGKIQDLRCDFRLAGRHIRRHNFRLLRACTYVRKYTYVNVTTSVARTTCASACNSDQGVICRAYGWKK